MKIFWTIMVAMSIAACLKVEHLPIEPTLAFKSMQATSDSGQFIFSFQDGDGDFGLNSEDIDAPNYCDTCPYYYNLLLDYYEKRNGVWTYVPPITDVPFNLRVPFVQPTGQNKTQIGDIKVDIQTYYFPGPYDTCRFEARIIDRAFHYSNSVTTPEFYKH
jgi:hypothetical protein